MKRPPKCGFRSYVAPPELKELEQKLEEVRKEKEAAVQSQEFEKAAALRDEEQKLREQLEATAQPSGKKTKGGPTRK